MKILTIISNYNEEEAIEDAIRDVRENATIETDLLVIDNSSTDRSIRVIQQTGVEYLSHPVNTGGSAGVIKTALRYAYEKDYDVYCHMDGDNQHKAEQLSKIMQPIIDKKADIVIGSRFIQHEGFQSLPIRRIGIRLFSSLLSKITKKDLTDPTSGFRAYNRKAIEYFTLKHQHEIEPCVQMLLLANYAGLILAEAPVVMRHRETGKSEFNFYRSLAFPIKGIMSIVAVMIQKDSIQQVRS